MKRASLSVEGMTCVNCARAIEIGLKQLKGVAKVQVSFEIGRVSVEYDANLVSQEDIKWVIEDLGYRVVSTKTQGSLEKPILVFCVISSLLIMTLMFIPHGFSPLFQFILATLVQALGGYRFYRSAYHSLKVRVGNMDVLVSLGSTAAYLYSLLAWLKVLPGEPFFETSAFLITFVRVGKYLEERSKGKALSLLKELFAVKMTKVTLITKGGEREVLVKDLIPGDTILLRPGSIVPVDGVIASGQVEVDESLVTGESLPVAKGEGMPLLSGSLIINGSAKVLVERGINQSFLAMLLQQIESALERKPTSQRFADQFSHYFVQAVLLLSVLVFFYWYLRDGNILMSFNFALAVLVISCPCAFGIAIPLALSMGLLRGYRQGVLVKNPEAIERARVLQAIILDKTGTLTEGKPKIVGFIAYEDETYVLNLALSLAKHSNHHYSKAIVEFAQEKGAKGVFNFNEVKEVAGRGIQADNYFLGRASEGGRLILSSDGRVLAEFEPDDKIREEAREVIDFLRSKKLRVVILSGDDRKRVEKVGKELGIESYFSEVRPEEKLKYLEEVESRYGPTAMVGDGLNDAPALAKAYVSLVMGEGVDLSKRIGDVVLLSGVRGLKVFLEMSYKTLSRIKQNLFWAFIYNLVGIPVAAGLLSGFGIYLKPEIAGLMMVASSLSVTINSIRN